MSIEWHQLAQGDLIELIKYIANDNPVAATRIHEEIRRQVGLLETYPEIGRLGRIRGTRELVVSGTPFIVVYRTGEHITILRVLHGAQRWPAS